MDQEWLKLREQLKNTLARGQFELWILTIEFLGYENGSLKLGCRNRFHMEWLRDRLEKKLLSLAQEYFPQAVKVEYGIVKDDEVQTVGETSEPEGPRQIGFGELIKHSPKFNPRFTFDRFVTGKSNQFAHAAAMAMAGGSSLYDQGVYLMSDTGLGKSHLSHAIGNYLHTANPSLRVQYVTSEQFTNEMVFSLKHGNIEAFKNKFRNGCDVLLLEKVDFLSGKEKVQGELVHTLDELMNRGKRVICTGNSYPRDIPKLSGELQSRLSGIMMAPIEKPDYRTRVEIIKRKTRSENIKLPMEIVEYLAERITGDVRRIESCLVGMAAKTSILGIPYTLDLAREVSHTMLDRLPKITVDHIQQVICASFQVAIEDLKSNSRRKEIALARKVGMYLSRQYTSESLVSIGKRFNRSHSSVVYAVNGLSKELESSGSKLRSQVEYVTRRVETSCLS